MNTPAVDEPLAAEVSASPARRPVRRGEPCPHCDGGPLDYNGMLDLECPQCGYTEGPGAGCT